MSLVIDTGIVSYFVKRDTRAADYAPYLAGHILVISFILTMISEAPQKS